MEGHRPVHRVRTECQDGTRPKKLHPPLNFLTSAPKSQGVMTSPEAFLSETSAKEQKQQKIIEAAIYHFNRFGFSGTKTSDIAFQAGIAESQLFKEFQTKAQLANTCLHECLTSPYIYRVKDAPELTEGKDIFEMICGIHIKYYLRAPEFYLFAFTTQHQEFIDEHNKLLKQQLRLESYQMIERLQAHKQIRPISPNIVIAMFFGSFARFIVQATEGHSTPTQKDLQALAETLWIAFKRDSAA